MKAGERRRRTGTAVIFGILGEVFMTAGFLVVLFVVWQTWWTDVVADRAQAGQVSQLESQFKAEAALDRTTPKPTSTATPKPTSTATPKPTSTATPTGPGQSRLVSSKTPIGQAFAVIQIPRFGRDYARPVLQGTDHEQLDRGIGHVPGSVMPGQIGNFVTAGHRVTFGKPYNRIDELTRGDAIVVETVDGWSVYRYQRSRIVTPDQVEVTAPVPDHPKEEPTQRWMTMIACHPKFSARQRYIGYALLQGFYPRTGPGLPQPVAAALAGAGA